MFSLSVLTFAACEQRETTPLIEATGNDHQGILAAEHLAELRRWWRGQGQSKIA